MSNHHHEHGLHLGCGCHNVAADVLIALAARIRPPVVAEDRSPAAADAGAAPFIVRSMNGTATIRPLTQGDAEATVEAFGVADGQVVAVGAYDAVVAAMAKHSPGVQVETRVLSAGQCVVPGLIEPHVHIVPTAVLMGLNDYSPFGHLPLDDLAASSQPMAAQVLRPDYSMAQLKNRLDHDVKQVAQGKWLLGVGVDAAMLLLQSPADRIEGKTLLTLLDRSFLDEVSADTPILLASASLHTMYANTAALTIIWNNSDEVREQFATLDDYLATGGVLQEEPQIAPAVACIDAQQQLEVAESLPNNLGYFFGVARQRGVTMVYDAGMRSVMADLLLAHLIGCRLAGRPERMRIGMAHMVVSQDDLANVGKFAVPVAPSASLKHSIDFYYGSVKLVTDGSNQGLTGYQSERYCCAPNDFGMYNYIDGGARSDIQPETQAPDVVVDLVKAISAMNWPNMVHANGDQSIDYVLQAYGQAKDGQDGDTFLAQRNRIEHCSLLDQGRMDKIANLGVNPSFLIGHVGYWGWAFKDYIFKDKAEMQLDPCAGMQSREVRFTLHSDCSVSPLGPLRQMEQAVTRKMEGSPEALAGAPVQDIPVLNEAERISAAQALRAATFDAAWQCHAEHLVGSLEPGKLADFVVLAQDPVALDADQAYKVMRDIAVMQVWVGGRQAL